MEEQLSIASTYYCKNDQFENEAELRQQMLSLSESSSIFPIETPRKYEPYQILQEIREK